MRATLLHSLRALMAVMLLGVLLAPALTSAADICTTTPSYQPQNATGGGIVNTFIDLVAKKTMALMEKMYKAFIEDSSYPAIYSAMVMLYVVMYGVMVLFNMTSTQPYEILKRLIKIAIIAMFLSPTGWNTFNVYVVQASWGTMNELLGLFGQIATGSTAPVEASQSLSKEPLSIINAVFQMIFSLKFFVMVLSTIFTSMAGPFYAFLLILGAIGIVRAIIGAVATYFKVMITLSFLLGLAPLFIPLALFSETKKIFSGWMQQVVGLILQPIMLFGFLAFFMVMIRSTINALLMQSDYCWVTTDFVQGAPQQMRYWRPQVSGQQGIGEVRTQGWFGALPINVDDIIMFLVLTELTWRYSKYVTDIAKDFGGGALNLVSTGSDVKNFSQENLMKDNTQNTLDNMAEKAKENHADEKKALAGTGSLEEQKLNQREQFAKDYLGNRSATGLTMQLFQNYAANKKKKQEQARSKVDSPMAGSEDDQKRISKMTQKRDELKKQADKETDPAKKAELQDRVKKQDAVIRKEQDKLKAKDDASKNKDTDIDNAKKEEARRKLEGGEIKPGGDNKA